MQITLNPRLLVPCMFCLAFGLAAYPSNGSSPTDRQLGDEAWPEKLYRAEALEPEQPLDGNSESTQAFRDIRWASRRIPATLSDSRRVTQENGSLQTGHRRVL
jgi:hypothetical protein